MAGEIIRRPAVPRPIRIRRNVLTLQPDDPILTFYGSAIAAMKPKDLDDFSGLRYQAAIHDYIRADDPFAAATDRFPPDQNDFWRACEHRAWFFLPWHRMYLFHFEMIVLREVIRQGGPTDWALPYWNYSANDPNAKRLPAAFRDTSPIAGLRLPNRDPQANAGNDFLQGDPTNINCLTEPNFAGDVGSGNIVIRGFGGLQPRGANPQVKQNRKNHSSGIGTGAVESAPHNGMHGALNGPNTDDTPGPVAGKGFMGNFTRAPLDPIFWVHHCNIDRLWEVWAHSGGHTNPTANDDWMTAVSWAFRDSTGTRVEMRAKDVLDTRGQLFYEYDDISNPFLP
jgi:tyrosinase